jgi:hypothetical protein
MDFCENRGIEVFEGEESKSELSFLNFQNFDFDPSKPVGGRTERSIQKCIEIFVLVSESSIHFSFERALDRIGNEKV